MLLALTIAASQSKQNFTVNPRYTKQVEKDATREGRATAVGVQSDNGPIPFGVNPPVVEFEQYTVRNHTCK